MTVGEYNIDDLAVRCENSESVKKALRLWLQLLIVTAVLVCRVHFVRLIDSGMVRGGAKYTCAESARTIICVIPYAVH